MPDKSKNRSTTKPKRPPTSSDSESESESESSEEESTPVKQKLSENKQAAAPADRKPGPTHETLDKVIADQQKQKTPQQPRPTANGRFDDYDNSDDESVNPAITAKPKPKPKPPPSSTADSSSSGSDEDSESESEEETKPQPKQTKPVTPQKQEGDKQVEIGGAHV